MNSEKKPPGQDIFCTPENGVFLATKPYTELDTSQRKIRLVKLLPISRNGFIECELLPKTSLAEAQGNYSALSYGAGDARETNTIRLNGVECNVFANLRHALVQARLF
jgi:hypothetical protein